MYVYSPAQYSTVLKCTVLLQYSTEVYSAATVQN